MPTINNKKLQSSEPYASIMRIFEFCVTDQDTNAYKKNHVSRHQLIYALSGRKYHDKDTKKFFEELHGEKQFDALYNEKKIIPWSGPAQRLTEKLDLLKKRGYIDFHGNPGYRTYTLSDKAHAIAMTRQYRQALDHWDYDGMLSIQMQHGDEYFEQSSFVICGFPRQELDEKMSRGDTRVFMDTLKSIHNDIYKLLELKHKALQMSEKKYYKKLEEHIDEPDYLMNLNDIGLYYHASKKMIKEKKK